MIVKLNKLFTFTHKNGKLLILICMQFLEIAQNINN